MIPWKLSRSRVLGFALSLVHFAPVSVMAQSGAQTPTIAYAAVMTDAEAAFGRLSEAQLALSPDAALLAISVPDSVIIASPSTDFSARVVLKDAQRCSALMWNPAGTRLALTCGPSDQSRGRSLFVWERGGSRDDARLIRVVDGAADTTSSYRDGLQWPPAQWLDDGRLMFLYVPPDWVSSPPRSARAGQRGERPPVPARRCRFAVAPYLPAMSGSCSDSVDVFVSNGSDSAPTLSNSRDSDRIGRSAYDSLQVVVHDLDKKRSQAAVHVAWRVAASRLVWDIPPIFLFGDRRELLIVPRDTGSARDFGHLRSHVVHGIPPKSLNDARQISADGSAVTWLSSPPWTSQPTPWQLNEKEAGNGAPDTVYIAGVTAAAMRIAVPLRDGLINSGLMGGLHVTRQPTPMWTPDGSAILVAVRGRLWRVNASSARVRLLSDAYRSYVLDVVWQSNDRALVVTIDMTTGSKAFRWMELTTGESRLVSEEKQSTPRQITVAVTRGAPVVAYIASTLSSPSNVYVLRLAGPERARANLQQVTRIGSSVALPEICDTTIAYQVPGGETATAVLIRPAGASGPLPTIVFAYPGHGSWAPNAHAFGMGDWPAYDVFSAIDRGYAIMFAGIPLQLEGIYGAKGPAIDMTEAMGVALDAVAHTGWVDTARVGVLGHSYGGYMVNFLVTQTTRFKAAVSMAGSSNLAASFFVGSSTTSNRYYEEGQGRMGLPFWEAPERYVKNSPVSYLDQVVTPLLLIHGLKDATVPVEESYMMFRGLARLGKPAELVLYNGAGHMDPAWFHRALDWFDKYLTAGDSGTQ